MNLADKTAIVTGSTSGIARGRAATSANVAINGFGSADIVVTNAGIPTVDPVETRDPVRRDHAR